MGISQNRWIGLMSLERIKQLYGQCKETYARCLGRYDTVYVIDNVDVRCPNDFDDEFNVPAMLLFQELCNSNKKLSGHYDIFRCNLLKVINDNRGFDIKRLTQMPSSTRLNEYRVYFEVFFLKENDKVNLPFRRQITVNNLQYRWCGQQTMAAAFRNYHLQLENSTGMPLFTLNQQRSLHFPELTDEDREHIHSIMVTIRAKNAYQAISLALSNFELVINSINITQAMGMQSIHMGGKRLANLTAVTTGIYIANSILNPNDSALSSSDTKIYELPKQKLSFTNNQSHMNLFHEILKASSDNTPVSRRVAAVVEELSLVYSTDIPGLRQLSCWRCLELATAKSNNNRKEKEVVQIFQNYYYSNQFWKQMGDLVLKLRNTYVHQGKFINSGGFSSDYYLNWSQQYAEKSLLILLYLYKNRSIWSTEQQIDKFFDYYAESNDSLKIAQHLLSARTKK